VKFDLERTHELAALFEVPRAERGDAWADAFFAAVPDASLAAGDPQVIGGPDGFPYFRLRLPDEGPFETFCVTHVLDACLENGFGIVVTAAGPQPEWVFTYGDLWSFASTGRFVVSTGETTTLEAPRQVLVGAPSDTTLPAYARGALRRALAAQGVTDPLVFLVHAPGNDPEQAFAFRPLPDPQALLWYLPRHYALMSAPDDWAEGEPL
jgi:hypothetical protein